MSRIAAALLFTGLAVGPSAAHATDLHLVSDPLRSPVDRPRLSLSLRDDAAAPPAATEWTTPSRETVLALSIGAAAALLIVTLFIVGSQQNGQQWGPLWTFT